MTVEEEVATPFVVQVGTWTWSTQTNVPPGNQQARTDTGNWNTATKINITNQDTTNADHSDTIVLLSAGDVVRFAVSGDDTRYATFTVQAAPVRNSGYFTISVVPLEQVGAIANNNASIVITANPTVPVGAAVKITVNLSPNQVNVITPDIAENLVNLIAGGLQTVAHLVSEADFCVYIQGGGTINYVFDIKPASQGVPFP